MMRTLNGFLVSAPKENIEMVKKARKNNPAFGKFFEKLEDLDTDKLEKILSDKRFNVSEEKRTRVLLDCLRHEEFEVIKAAGMALGDLVDSSHMWELIGLSMEERHGPSVWAAELLGRIDDDSIVQVLFEIFEETGDFHVFKTIGKIANPSAIAKLAGYLESDDEWLRMRAMQTLVELRNPAANEIFIKALSHRDRSIADNAATGLSFVGDSSAVPALIDALAKWNATLPKTAGTPIRMQFIGDGNGFFTLNPPLFAETTGIGHPVDGIAHALGKIGDKRAVPALLEIAKTSPHDMVSTASVEALARIGGVENSFFIKRLAKRFPQGVRSVSENALRKFECLPDLYVAFLESDKAVRETVRKIIDLIVSGVESQEDVGDFFVRWDIALEKAEKACISEDLTEGEIALMNKLTYEVVKAKEAKLAEKRE